MNKTVSRVLWIVAGVLLIVAGGACMLHPGATLSGLSFLLGMAKIYDDIFEVQNDDAFAAAKLIAKHEGILVGISSGAALHAALELAKKPENAGKTIVALLPDSGDRYYSTTLFAD